MISKDDVALRTQFLGVNRLQRRVLNHSVGQVLNSAHPVIEFADEVILRLSRTERHFQDTVCPKLLYTLKTARANVLAKLVQRQAFALTSGRVKVGTGGFCCERHVAPSLRSRMESRFCPW